MPDELLEGYLGRIAAAHGCNSVGNLIEGLRSTQSTRISSSRLHQVVATALGLSLEEVQQRFTTQPALRPFTDARKQKKPAARAGSATRLLTGLSRRSSVDALMCKACALNDVASGRSSHWRRAHHLPGVDWCTTHWIALTRFDPAAFEVLPTEAVRSLTGKDCPSFEASPPDTVLGRYSRLLIHWLDHPTAMSSETLNRVVQEGCRKHGLRMSQVGKRPVLSDWVLETVPTPWLAQYWPMVLSKAPGMFLGRLDGISKDRHVAYPGASAALALAAVFDSVNAIVAALAAAQMQVDTEVDADASHAMDAARRAFLDGAGLGAACAAHGVSTEDFELWLRATVKASFNHRNTAHPVLSS